MTEKEQKAKKLAVDLYSCLNHIDELETELRKQYDRMHKVATEFDKLDHEWYRNCFDSLRPNIDIGKLLELVESRDEYEHIKELIESHN